MPTAIDTRVTPALHAQNVREIEGYNDDTAVFLAATETAFDAAYLGVVAVHDAREQAKKNPVWNEAQQIIQTDDLARKHLNRITRTFDSTRAALEKTIASYEQQLTTPAREQGGGNGGG